MDAETEKKQQEELLARLKAIEDRLGLNKKQPTQDEVLRSRKRS